MPNQDSQVQGRVGEVQRDHASKIIRKLQSLKSREPTVNSRLAQK